MFVSKTGSKQNMLHLYNTRRYGTILGSQYISAGSRAICISEVASKAGLFVVKGYGYVDWSSTHSCTVFEKHGEIHERSSCCIPKIGSMYDIFIHMKTVTLSAMVNVGICRYTVHGCHCYPSMDAIWDLDAGTSTSVVSKRSSVVCFWSGNFYMSPASNI